MTGLSTTGIHAQSYFHVLGKQEEAKSSVLDDKHVVATFHFAGSDTTDINHPPSFSTEALKEILAYVNSVRGQPFISQIGSAGACVAPETVEEAQASDTESIAGSSHTDEANIAEYAFAFFDECLCFLNKSAQGDLPDFEKFCVAVPSLRQNLVNAITALDSIKDIFKDASLFQSKPENLDEKAFQARLEKLQKIASAMTALKPIQNDIETVEKSFKSTLPSEKKSYFIRVFNGVVSSFCTLLSLFSIPTAAISLLFSLGNLAFESRNHGIQQGSSEWKSVRKSIQKLNKCNPSKEEEVFPIIATLQTQQKTVHQEQERTQQELESTKAKLAETQQELADVKQLMLSKLQALEAKLESGQSQAESAAITSGKSANESAIPKLRQVA